MPDLVFAEANDVVAEGAEPLVAQSIGFLVERRRVQPVAIDLCDNQMRLPNGVDPADEAVIVEHVDLESRLWETAINDKSEEIALEATFGMAACALELLDQCTKLSRTGSASLPEFCQHPAHLQNCHEFECDRAVRCALQALESKLCGQVEQHPCRVCDRNAVDMCDVVLWQVAALVQLAERELVIASIR